MRLSHRRQDVLQTFHRRLEKKSQKRRFRRRRHVIGKQSLPRHGFVVVVVEIVVSQLLLVITW